MEEWAQFSKKGKTIEVDAKELKIEPEPKLKPKHKHDWNIIDEDDEYRYFECDCGKKTKRKRPVIKKDDNKQKIKLKIREMLEGFISRARNYMKMKSYYTGELFESVSQFRAEFNQLLDEI